MAENARTADVPNINLGSVISEKLTESLKNMDVISIIKQMIASQPNDEETEQLKQNLEGVLEKYNSMGDNEKELFTDKLKEVLASKLSSKLKDNINFNNIENVLGQAIVNQLLYLGVFLILVFIFLVFFGYKLYKSIKEKEKKREEKKKAKQMKKKK